MLRPRFTDRGALAAEQLAKLRQLLAELVGSNRFYAPRLAAAGLGPEVGSLDEFISRMGVTTKAELVEDQRLHPPFGTNLTYSLEHYARYTQTSGTTGRPLRWLDTPQSWDWMLGSWIMIFEAAGVSRGDRVFLPFSYGPFLGFWTAHDAAVRFGCLTIPGGGLSSVARLHMLVDNGATVIVTTPTYALRLGEVAAGEGIDLARSGVARIIVAGEPGGSVTAVRERISSLWGGARVFDHHGMTEVGPVSFPNPDLPGVLHVLEGRYLAEVVDLETGHPVAPGETGELIVTTLGRGGSPLLRYRTGDLVRLSARSPQELGYVEAALEGGILARADDMVVVRGVNLYPSAVDDVIRRDEAVAEYQVELRSSGALAELEVRVEPRPGADAGALVRRLADALRLAFQLRIPVAAVEPGALPRFELKAKRWLKVD